MGIRKDQLWVVPVFCIGAGIATHIVYFAAHFLVWIVSYPDDGWVNVYDPLVFGGCFLAALLLGGLCFFPGHDPEGAVCVRLHRCALRGGCVYS